MGESIWEVPIPTFELIMSNKNIDLRLVAALILISKRDCYGRCNEPDERYIYNNDLSIKREEIKYILGFSESTYKRKFKALRDANIIRHVFSKKDGVTDLIYYLKCKLQVGEDYKFFTTIKSDLLEDILIKTDDKSFKIYCAIKYKSFASCGIVSLTYNWFANTIGFSSNSKDCIASALKNLQDNNFISIVEERIEHKKEVNGRMIANPIIRKYYSLIIPEVKNYG